MGFYCVFCRKGECECRSCGQRSSGLLKVNTAICWPRPGALLRLDPGTLGLTLTRYQLLFKHLTST